MDQAKNENEDACLPCELNKNQLFIQYVNFLLIIQTR